jgi:hypothetical protein
VILIYKSCDWSQVLFNKPIKMKIILLKGKSHRLQHIPVLSEDRLPLVDSRLGAGEQAELLLRSKTRPWSIHGAGNIRNKLNVWTEAN